MTNLIVLAAVCFVSSLVGTFIAVLLGVAGGSRAVMRSVRELESDHISLEERFTRQQKKQAGVETASKRDHVAEAKAIAAQLQFPPQTRDHLPGRANFQ
jgi:hypothetical protein